VNRFSCAGSALIAGAALVISSHAAVTAAPAAITGTVKITGAASSADAVVYIQNASGTFAASKPETIDQKQMQFIPHVLPVVAGTTVKFLNDDPTAHNVFSPDNEKFNLGTWPQGQTKDYAFAKCAKFPCVYTLLCRVHPEMEGYVVVLQNPYFAVSSKDGRYTIDGVPPGNYTLAVWHQKAKAQPKPVTVDAGKPATVDFTLAR
jgi:plastocyanin